MPEITVKGVDTSDAMDQVQKLLGKDAVILETRRRGKSIEIVATNEMIVPLRRKPAPAAPEQNEIISKFADILHKTAQTMQSDAPEAHDNPAEEFQDLQDQSFDPEPIINQSQFEPTSDLAQAQEPTEQLSTQTLPQFAYTAVLPQQSLESLTQDNVVLLGPILQDLETVALQLAGIGLKCARTTRPQINVCVDTLRPRPPAIQERAKFVGCKSRSVTVETFNPTENKAPQITLASLETSTVPQFISDTAWPNDTRIMIVLPAYMSEVAMDKILSDWGKVAAGVIFTGSQLFQPSKAIIDVIMDHNLQLCAESIGQSMMTGLSQPEAATIAFWTGVELPPPSVQETFPTPRVGMERDSSLPSLFRKRWTSTEIEVDHAPYEVAQ